MRLMKFQLLKCSFLPLTYVIELSQKARVRIRRIQLSLCIYFYKNSKENICLANEIF
jgi:hypothetical protein